MSSYKNEQHRLTHRGRHYHFVSYEARPANVRRGEEAMGPMWYLMGPNKRWPVMPHVLGQPTEEIMLGLMNWIEEQAAATATA